MFISIGLFNYYWITKCISMTYFCEFCEFIIKLMKIDEIILLM